MEHRVVSHKEWVAARTKFLADEKEFTRKRDQLSQARRDLPWELVEKEYVFEGASGKRTLAELFDGRNQLVIYHAMFNPATTSPQTTWTEDSPCFACSFWMDSIDRQAVHLNHRDVTIAAVAIAPYEKLAAYRERMGWGFPVYSAAESDFNFDYHVSRTPDEMKAGKADYNYREDEAFMTESPGVSVFLRDGGRIYHAYSTYARGLDMLNATYNYLDLVPKGRDEGPMGMMDWLHRRDEYPE